MFSTPSLAPTLGCEARPGPASAIPSVNAAARTARRSVIYLVCGSFTFGGVTTVGDIPWYRSQAVKAVGIALMVLAAIVVLALVLQSARPQ